MARIDTLSLHALRNATNVRERFEALRQLKNDIIGHERKKAAVIREGVVDELVETLKPSAKSTGKGRVPDQHERNYRTEQGYSANGELSDEDKMRLQAMFVVNSLANAGNAFIAPLVAGGIITPLLHFLSSDTTPPRLILESLRTLLTITSSLRNDPLDCYREINNTVSDQIVQPYSPTLDNLIRILQQHDSDSPDDEQYILALQLLKYLAEGSEKRQKTLASAGILDLLAAALVGWVRRKQIPLAPNEFGRLPASSSSHEKQEYPCLIRAIAAIIGKSAYRSARFISCRHMLTVFPETSEILPHLDAIPPSVTEPNEAVQGRWERFLPQVSSHPSRSESSRPSQFPPLASNRPQPSNLSNDVVAWLIHMARSTTGDDRVASLSLLASLLNATNMNIQYDRHLALLVVPLLVRLISESGSEFSGDSPSIRGLYDAMIALGQIITNSATLQTAAQQSKAVDVLCAVLKKTMDPLPKAPRERMWSPTPQSGVPEPTALDQKTVLGPFGFPRETCNILFIRACTMSALSALAAKEDNLRKAVIDQGAMQGIVDSLTPHTIVYHMDSTEPDPSLRECYPSIVLLPATDLLVTLSRSVGMLRTSLIDAKVALPVLELAKHKEMDVKVNATNALTNMLLQFSPMKEDLLENGVLKLLCDHAKSSSMDLRISALWALKHMVLQTEHSLKLQVLDELGSGFLLSLLSADSTSSRSHLAIANVRGEKVDLLNDEPDMEVDGPLLSSDDEGTNQGTGYIATAIRNEFGPPPEYLSKLRPMKNSEQSPTAKARRDDIQIQHHALDIIRNMLAEPTDQHPELVDQVLNLLGAPRFFDLVISKFKAKPGYSTSQSGTTAGKRPTVTGFGGGADHSPSYIDPDQYCHPDVIHSACYVLAHIANGRPSHKTLVISQPSMMTALLPHFGHPEQRIRVGCLWILCNVLWVENSADTKTGKIRAMDLRRAGIEDKCRELLHDPVLDVNERAKYVVDAFTKLLGQPPSSGATPGRMWD